MCSIFKFVTYADLRMVIFLFVLFFLIFLLVGLWLVLYFNYFEFDAVLVARAAANHVQV